MTTVVGADELDAWAIWGRNELPGMSDAQRWAIRRAWAMRENTSIVRPEPPFMRSRNGKLVHRVKMVRQFPRLNNPYMPSYHAVDAWCRTGLTDGVLVAEPDFVCRRCEQAAVAAGQPSTLAFPESGCEAWHGIRHWGRAREATT